MHNAYSPIIVDVPAWVKSTANPVQKRERQATHIILAAVARISSSHTMYLKGGLLLGLLHNSPRMTKDIDFTAGFKPQEGIDTEIRTALNNVLSKVVVELGYVGAQIEVSKVKVQPQNLPNPIAASFPALEITVQYLSKSRGKQKTDHVRIDLSFNEPSPHHIDIINIGNGIEIPAYNSTEVIAEKYRALLQQVPRKRERRQDVYDIDFLSRSLEFDAGQKSSILEAMIEKCHSRNIYPDIDSLDDPELRRRASADWASNELEVGRLPEFDCCFKNVRCLYRQLPWGDI